MHNEDDFIAAAVAGLRSEYPRRQAEELVVKSRKVERMSKVRRGIVATATTGGIAAVFLLSFAPRPAYATLVEAVNKSGTERIIHRHMRTEWKKSDLLEIGLKVQESDQWVLPGRQVVASGSEIHLSFEDGREVIYDRRFPFAVEKRRPGQIGKIWQPSVKDMLKIPSQRLAGTRTVQAHGGAFVEYDFENAALGESKTRIFVDPTTNLVRFIEGDHRDRNFDYSTTDEYDYPSAAAASADAASIPADVPIRTEEAVSKDFTSAIHRADQTQSLSGVRITLYGVVFVRTSGYGDAMEVVTRGGDGQNFSSPHAAEAVGLKTNPLRHAPRTPRQNAIVMDDGTEFVDKPTLIDGEPYWINTCDGAVDQKIPGKITIKVPVWRVDRSRTYPTFRGDLHPTKFVGNVVFTTSKIFYESRLTMAELPDEDDTR
jgi:hypothetical protein